MKTLWKRLAFLLLLASFSIGVQGCKKGRTASTTSVTKTSAPTMEHRIQNSIVACERRLNDPESKAYRDSELRLLHELQHATVNSLRKPKLARAILSKRQSPYPRL